MPSDKTIIITDASCLILLEKIGHLELLPQLFNSIITTPEIVEEFNRTIPFWLQVISVVNKPLQDEYSLMVDKGEASAIALSQEININYLATDDLQARKLALKLGIEIIGTLGILLKAKQSGLIPFLKPVFEQIKLTDFRVTRKLIEEVLKEAGE